jgi:alpha-D-xyloside xylohydrolase
MWKFGPEVEKILMQYDQFSYRLLPYIYSAAWGITNRGEVLMRALPYVYPADLSVRNVSDQFMFGDSLLVNPVTEHDATTRWVVLPAGYDWVDFSTGQLQRGGQTITTDAPIDQMPIFVRAGSILAMGPVVNSAADVEDPLGIRTYGGKDADFQLYEDSGDGFTYEKGARATINLHWDTRRNVLSIGERLGTFP